MTEDQQNEALDYLNNANKAREDLKTTVGNTERKRRIEVNTVVFLKTLIDECGGTFVWEGPRKGDKHATIFEALSAKMPGYGEMSLRGKNEHIDDVAPKLRYGFNGARKWLAEWFNATVYCVPQNNESSFQTILTLNPNFVTECGRTAAEMQTTRDYKLAFGQMKASAMRIVASADDQQADSALDKLVVEVKASIRDAQMMHEQIQSERNRKVAKD